MLTEITTLPEVCHPIFPRVQRNTDGAVSALTTSELSNIKLHLDMLSNATSSKLLQSHPCLQQPVGLYLEIRDGQDHCPGQVLLVQCSRSLPRPPLDVLGDERRRWAVLMGPSFSQSLTNAEQLRQGCFIFPLHGGERKEKGQKPTIRKRFISKRSRAMLDLHIFSCFPKEAHVRYFLSFMLLAGMHHEVQICNLLSVLVIRHGFLCLLI